MSKAKAPKYYINTKDFLLHAQPNHRENSLDTAYVLLEKINSLMDCLKHNYRQDPYYKATEDPDGKHIIELVIETADEMIYTLNDSIY